MPMYIRICACAYKEKKTIPRHENKTRKKKK